MPETAVVTAVDKLVCRCLQVRESQLQDCATIYGMTTLQEVRQHCGAGGGCNACHRKIRDFLAAHRPCDESTDCG